LHGHRLHELGRTPLSIGFTRVLTRCMLLLAEQSWAAPAPPYKIWGLAVRWCSAHLPGRFLQTLQVPLPGPAKARRPESNSSREREADRFGSSPAFIRVQRTERRPVALRRGWVGWWFSRSIPSWPCSCDVDADLCACLTPALTRRSAMCGAHASRGIGFFFPVCCERAKRSRIGMGGASFD